MECALSPLMCMRVVLVMLPDGEVTIRQGANDPTTTASPTATEVVPNQLLGQLDPKVLDIGERAGTGVVLHQDECICYCHI